MTIGSRPLVILLGFLAALAPLSAQSKQEAVNCSYDQNSMLQLDQFTFDQDDKLGWRKLGDRPECRNEAAKVIDLYIKRHEKELSRKWLVPSFRWHEAGMRAMAGDTRQAIRVMRQSLKPLKGPEGADTWTAYAEAWNEYVNASIAFLERDLEALTAARTRLAALPVPSDFAEVDGSAVGHAPVWPQNLDVVDGLIACFGKPYEEAYGSAECRAAGQKR